MWRPLHTHYNNSNKKEERQTITSTSNNVEKPEPSNIAAGIVKWGSHFENQFLKKLNIELSYDPSFHF